jgi:hypothetical protein
LEFWWLIINNISDVDANANANANNIILADIVVDVNVTGYDVGIGYHQLIASVRPHLRTKSGHRRRRLSRRPTTMFIRLPIHTLQAPPAKQW